MKVFSLEPGGNNPLGLVPVVLETASGCATITFRHRVTGEVVVMPVTSIEFKSPCLPDDKEDA